jgi:hypothetical protein
MKAYFIRTPLQSTLRIFQDVPLFLGATQLSAKLQNLFLRVEQLVATLLFFVRASRLQPLVQAVDQNAQTGGDFRSPLTLLGNLTNGFILELGRVSLMTH